MVLWRVENLSSFIEVESFERVISLVRVINSLLE